MIRWDGIRLNADNHSEEVAVGYIFSPSSSFSTQVFCPSRVDGATLIDVVDRYLHAVTSHRATGSLDITFHMCIA